jgi:hypothetical protein
MRQLSGLLAVAATAGLVACGGAAVTVQASVERADGSSIGLADLLVRLLPYDRDAVFRELEHAYGRPEPTLPDSLRAMQDAIGQAQGEWAGAETLWNAARDSLKRLSDRMAAMERATAAYAAAYREFLAQEAVVGRTQQVSRAAYARFQELQRRFSHQRDSVRLARGAWADAAFAGVDSAIAARKSEAGLREYADTTNGNGVAVFESVSQGQYWVHARHELPYEELYWNVPVTVNGDSVALQLNRQNAQVRPKL